MGGFEHAEGSVRAGDTIENSVSRERLTFLATSRDTGGAYTRVRLTLPPHGAGTPPHLHTILFERFEVVSGRLRVAFGGGEPPLVLAPGESASVAPFTVHRFWNGTDGETVFEAEVRPSGGFEDSMRASFGLARDGRTNRSVIPRNPLELGLLMQPADVYLPGLPLGTQKAIFGTLASAARLLGYEKSFRRYAEPGAREDGAGGAVERATLAVGPRKADGRVRELAAFVGWISLRTGLALTLNPRASAAFLGWNDRLRLTRVVGVAELIVGPGLLLSRDRARWILARALMNAALSGTYAWTLATGTPGRGRAMGGVVGMFFLTLTDYFLARRLRSVERASREPGE